MRIQYDPEADVLLIVLQDIPRWMRSKGPAELS